MLGEEGAVMTTLDAVAKKKQVEQSAEQQAAVELVRLAQEQGLSLTAPDGLLKQLTKTVLETALNEEMTEHLGHEKNGRPDPHRAGWLRRRARRRARAGSDPASPPARLGPGAYRAARFRRWADVARRAARR